MQGYWILLSIHGAERKVSDMQELIAAIVQVKKSMNIDRSLFAAAEIFYGGKWVLGKWLTLYLSKAEYPTLWPGGPEDRELLLQVARLERMNWELVKIDKHSFRYDIDFIPRQVAHVATDKNAVPDFNIKTVKGITMGDSKAALATLCGLDCKDCKDGYYYPLIGPREACQTCK